MAPLAKHYLRFLILVGFFHCGTSTITLCDRVLSNDIFDEITGWNTTKCALHTYDHDDIAECLDHLEEQTQQENKRLHFCFVGDSRVRQAFHSFWQMIPDFDLNWVGEHFTRRDGALHFNMNLNSSMLNTHISFQWRPNMNDDLISQFKHWMMMDTPSLIVTGYSSHHMDQSNARNYIEYEEWLVRLAPVLQELSNKTTIVWLQQNPIIETYGNKNGGGAITRSATNQKYDEFNIIAERVLRNTGVFLVNSTSRMAEEYVRSCSINDRTDNPNTWACFDFIHTGYMVVDRGSQILFNAMCNNLLSRSSHPSISIKPSTCCA